ncbi:MAG TPA: STAS domain-containing protein [Acidimicrobiia bacterium]|nr:STAS domain-containing protein [Acidimicrobiia bacterium]
MAEDDQISLDIRPADENGQVAVLVSGEIDMATAPRLESCLRGVTGHDVVVDLSGVTFLDSAGLAALVNARRVLRDAGYTLRTTGEQEHVRKILEIAGLLGPFHGE